MKRTCLLLILLTAEWSLAGDTPSSEALFNMSLEELMNVEVQPTGSLTSTTRRLTPSTVTTITREEIQSSGARSLNELLEIYVPNLQMIYHHWEPRHLGLRGIISDREDKYLLVVNGHVMNERTHFGVLSERDLPMLRDIHHVDIIRGPGSAIYGAGAISMVVNIVTDTARTFEGLEVTSRAGAVEEFYSQEIKWGKQFDKDRGWFAYLGVDKYPGADQDDAPMVYGTSFTDFWSQAYQGGRPYKTNNIVRDNEAYHNEPRVKSHVQYTDGPFDFWVRYTRGGEMFTFSQSNLSRPPTGWLGDWAGSYASMDEFERAGNGYQQLTAFAGYKEELSKDTTLEYSFSFDTVDYERSVFSSNASPRWLFSHSEYEILFRSVLTHTLNDHHTLAGGFEWMHEWFGKDSWGLSGSKASMSPWEQPPYNSISPDWQTDTVSLFAEDQYRFNDEWTVFLGCRVDKNTYTDYLFSPRLTTVFTPTEKDTFKWMLTRSVRMTFAEEMKWRDDIFDKQSDPEELDSMELRYERQLSGNLWAGFGGFYHDLDVIAWDSGTYGVQYDKGTRAIGNQKQYGLEAELIYRNEQWQLIASHGFTKLIEFDLNPGSNTAITAEPYGYGDDLANWSNHITKLAAKYKMDSRWSADGSVRMYWGYPGAKDYAQYQTDRNSPYCRDPGYDTPYGPSVFVNLGLEYQYSKTVTVRLDGYNLLGAFSEKYNKRLYGFNEYSDYRASAPSFAVTVIGRF